ncbi:MAG: type II toxin-antitoxin system HicB family antitoxin [Rhodobacter sp.]|nr:type II toxin-antitoxin system HicB family antitoxin [Rhodobacter sp.]MCY4241703.1 type II toxin-antitoxin system HicB family antitoxin [Rhodobacter sp.]
MRAFTTVIEHCPDTGLYVGYVPSLPGAHSQGAALDVLNSNLRDVVSMVVEDNAIAEDRFVGTQVVVVA